MTNIEDDEFETVSQEQLSSISTLVNKALLLQDYIETLENSLKESQRELRGIVEKDLVQSLLASGTSKWQGDNGLKVEIVNQLLVSEIKDPEKRRGLMKRRAEWLEKNEGTSMIRENIEVSFEKGEHEKALKIATFLSTAGVPYVHGETINSATFKSFVASMLEESKKETTNEIPLEELGLYQKTEAKISVPKVKK